MEIFKKFAIVYRWNIKENTGGPSGYLNNLTKGFFMNKAEINVFSLKKSNTTSEKETISTSKKVWSVFKKYNLHIPLLILFELRTCMSYVKKFNWNDDLYFKRATEQEFLQFESVEDLYDFKAKLKYKGTAILTPHRPEPFFSEKINELKTYLETSYSFPLLKRVLIKIEKKAYSLTDIFIFPSKEAMELYHSFPGFKEGVMNKPTRFVFSGAPVIKPTIDRVAYRNNLGIENDDKVIVYIGRHNHVKGYDLLVKACSNFNNASKIKFICAGKLSDIEYPKENSWTELGLISDPENLINCADIVILPNRSTYFDLIAVEVLAQGKILVASATGGNISLAQLSQGVVLFESENIIDMINKINWVFDLNENDKQVLETENIELYTTYCQIDKFANNYLNLIKEIIQTRE